MTPDVLGSRRAREWASEADRKVMWAENGGWQPGELGVDGSQSETRLVGDTGMLRGALAQNNRIGSLTLRRGF